MTSRPRSNASVSARPWVSTKADDDIGPGLESRVRALQHFVGLAYTGGGADKNLQLAERTVLPPGRFQERFRRGTLFRVAALICHKINICVAARRA
jgi:hypothetical protein